MAMGRLSNRGKVAWSGSRLAVELAPRHYFYDRCNEVLAEAEFDEAVEMLCQPYYKDGVGRPSIPPGRYFRMLFVGQFEGLEFGARDRLALRRFLVAASLSAPDGGRDGARPLDTQRDPLAVAAGGPSCRVRLHAGDRGQARSGDAAKRIGVDASTQEANAALRRLVRRDTGEDYQEMLRRLAQESGIETPSAEDLIRFDRARKDKTLSNADWASPTDPEARIARMKDGTTHLAYKPEHAVDLDTGVIVAARIHPADQGDTQTLAATLEQAEAMLDLVGSAPTPETPAEMIADKGYHSREGLKALEDSAWKSRISEKEQKAFARWHGDDAARRAVYNNRARLKSTVARQAFKLRAEKVERSFALILDIGGLRRTWLRGAGNVEKRYLIQVAAHNLGLVIRHRFGAGTPRQAMAVLLFISPKSCQVSLAIWAIHPPLEVADNDTIPPWKVVAFDCLIISI